MARAGGQEGYKSGMIFLRRTAAEVVAALSPILFAHQANDEEVEHFSKSSKGASVLAFIVVPLWKPTNKRSEPDAV